MSRDTDSAQIGSRRAPTWPSRAWSRLRRRPTRPSRAGGNGGTDATIRLAGLALLLSATSAGLMAALSIAADVPYSADSSRVYFGSDTHCMALFAGAAAASWAARRRARDTRTDATLISKRLPRLARLAYELATAATAVSRLSRLVRSVRVRAAAVPAIDRLTRFVRTVRVRAGAAPTSERFTRFARTVRDLAAAAALIFVVYAAFRWNEYTADIYRTGFLIFSLVAAALVALVASDGSRVARLLNVRILTSVGRRSYAIYLWHWPVDVVTRPGIDLHASPLMVFLLRIVLTGALSYASYRWIEVGLRSRWTREGLFASTSEPAMLVRSPGVMLGAPIAATLLLVNAAPISNAVVNDSASTSTVAPASTASASAQSQPSASSLSAPKQLKQRPVAHSQSPGCLTSPVHGPGASPSTAAVAFGDSVMLGAASSLHAHLSHLTIHATVGLLPRPILAEVRDMRAGQRPPVVIIHLGDNGFIPPGDLSRTLDALRGETRVVLVTAKVPRDWQGAADRVLRQSASRYQNVSVADWQAESQSHDDWFVSDGVHLTTAGIAAFGACVASAVMQSGN